MFDYGVDDPDRLACSIFLHNPDEANRIVLDFLNRALFVQDHKRASLWSAVLTQIEKMHSAWDQDALCEMPLAA
jgi:hypothetical protein